AAAPLPPLGSGDGGEYRTGYPGGGAADSSDHGGFIMRSLKLAVIGDPIAHTLSPQIHHAIAGKLGVDCSYTAHHVPLAQLESFVEMVRREGFDGFNITIPHKQNIIPYLAGLDPYAASCGAVNTVRIQDGNLYGYNT